MTIQGGTRWCLFEPWTNRLLVLAGLAVLAIPALGAAVAHSWPRADDLLWPKWLEPALILLQLLSLGGWLGLLYSSNTRLLSKRAAWLTLTLLAGVLVLGRAAQVRALAQLGLLPNPFHRTVWQQPDLSYVSATRARLAGLARELSIAQVRANQLSSVDGGTVETQRQVIEERRELTEQLQQQLVEWTELALVRLDCYSDQRLVLEQFACQVFPQVRFSADGLVKTEAEWILAARERVAACREREQTASAIMKQLNEEQRSADIVGNDAKGDRVQQPTHFSRVANELTMAEEELFAAKRELRRLQDRVAFLEVVESQQGGLNQRYPWLQLPNCIPGGLVWCWSILLTAFFQLLFLVAIYISGR